MGEWTVAGRDFRTRTDYEAAKRDAEYIEQIKRRYNLENREGLQQLLNDLKSGKYRFRTIIGQDFEEEILERLNKISQTGQASGQNTKKKIANNKSTGQRKKKVRLEDYDKNMQKSIKAELKKQERRRKLLLFSCVCMAILCFGYLGYYYYQAHQTEQNYNELAQLKDKEPVENTTTGSTVVINYDEDTEIVIPEVLDEYKNLFNKNKRLIGWIKIADTNIDYPVMQTVDNEYYLKHNFDHEYDKNGCIFLDKDCDVIERSTNLIVYGHHMSSGRMFGKLDKYSSKDYYEEHKYIQFDTIYEKGTYEVMYVFRSKIYEEDEIVFKYYQFIDVNSETEFNSNMKEMAAMSLYDTGVTAKYGDELLTLSTCDYYTDYGRFVVVAKRIN
ncbi:MAG: class B sortase [Lachnospiraceae bacterium]|nr:class B sortase [Lachnospiraceae bacterium]